MTMSPGQVQRLSLNASRSDVLVRPLSWPTGVDVKVLQPDVLEVSVGFDVEGDAVPISVEVVCEGRISEARLEVPLARSVKWGAPIVWAPGEGPEAREHPTLFIDASMPDVLWLFGGYGFVPRQYTVLNDLWQLDLRTARWSRVEAIDAPMLATLRVAPGARPGEHLLLGGQAPDETVSTEVFRVDVTQRPVRFSRVETTGLAPAMALGAVFPDPARNRLVTFGGFTGEAPTAMVKTLSLSATPAWTSSSSSGPTARYGFFAGVDRERALVFSGGQYPSDTNPINPAADVWALSLSSLSWTRLVASSPAAPGRRNGCGAVDPLCHRFYVWSGTPDGNFAERSLSVLDLERASVVWSKVAMAGDAPERSSCAAVYDAPRRRMLFGFGNTVRQRFADLQVLELGQ